MLLLILLYFAIYFHFGLRADFNFSKSLKHAIQPACFQHLSVNTVVSSIEERRAIHIIRNYRDIIAAVLLINI